MNALGKIVIVAVVLILLFVITMLVIGQYSNDYGWNVHLSTKDPNKPPYKEYVSGNSPDKIIYTNDHSIGQLYSTPLGDPSVPQEKVLYTKMYTDEVGYPNPTKATTLQRYNGATRDKPFVVEIGAAGKLVGPNAAIIQPGTKVNYTLDFGDNGKRGVENGVSYEYVNGVRTDYQLDGTQITKFADGSRRISYPDGKTEDIGSDGTVVATNSNDKITVGVSEVAKDEKAPEQTTPEVEADIAEAFSHFELMNVEGFEDFSKTYKKRREAAEGFSGTTDYSDFSKIYAAKQRSEGLDTTDDIGAEVGVVDNQAPLDYLYEVEIEDVLVEEAMISNHVTPENIIDVANGTGFDINRGGRDKREGLAVYPDRYYVDVTGQRIYRRRRNARTGDWVGPYIDINGNIVYNGCFEKVRGRTVRGWRLPTRRGVTRASVSTWEPHNQKISITTNTRGFDNSFSVSASEFLADSISRLNPIGDTIIKQESVFDTAYLLSE